MNSYTATEAKRYFGQILDECLFEKKAIPVQRHGRIIAYLVPSEKWVEPNQSLKSKPLPIVEQIYRLRDAYKGRKSKYFDTVKVIKEIREDRIDNILNTMKRGRK